MLTTIAKLFKNNCFNFPNSKQTKETVLRDEQLSNLQPIPSIMQDNCNNEMRTEEPQVLPPLLLGEQPSITKIFTILGPKCQDGCEPDVELMCNYTFGTQNDSFRGYNLDDLERDMLFYQLNYGASNHSLIWAVQSLVPLWNSPGRVIFPFEFGLPKFYL